MFPLCLQLTGSLALQEWIKGRVRQQFQAMDLHLIDKEEHVSGMRKLIVTNRSNMRENRKVIWVSMVPEEEICQIVCQYGQNILREVNDVTRTK